jgi:hypothetical protein
MAFGLHTGFRLRVRYAVYLSGVSRGVRLHCALLTLLRHPHEVAHSLITSLWNNRVNGCPELLADTLHLA